MNEMEDRELPYHYICALCGNGKLEEEKQGVSICPSCSVSLDNFINNTTWEKE